MILFQEKKNVKNCQKALETEKENFVKGKILLKEKFKKPENCF